MAHHIGQRARERAVAAGTPRLVLDTQVWLDLLLFRDPRVAALERALVDGGVEAVMDGRMRDELARVLGYPAFALDAERQAGIAKVAAGLATRVDTRDCTPPLPRCRDPDDQMFVEVACMHGASALLSRDAALLRMATRLRAFGVEMSTPAAWCVARGGTRAG